MSKPAMAAAARPIDILCAGLIVADHVAAPIDAIPRAGTLVFTPRTELTIGGCAANFAVNLSKLGIRAGVVGCVGDDILGRFVREELESAGVDCRHLMVTATAQTAVTLVVNVRGEDRRFIHAAGANVELTGREITPHMLAGTRIVYVGGFGLNPALSGENVAALFTAARESGVMTALDVVVGDPEAIPEMVAPVLPVTDVFLPNQDEARVLTGLDDPLQQAMQFRDGGAGTVVVTCGPKGAVLVDDERTLLAAAHDVEQVDGTGGGDAFAAGFLTGVLRGADAEACLRYGAAMGASCVRSPGATTGTFTAGELTAFVESTPLSVAGVEWLSG